MPWLVTISKLWEAVLQVSLCWTLSLEDLWFRFGWRFFGRMAFGCVLFAVLFFLLGICWFPLGKMVYKGEEVVPSLQKILCMFIVVKGYRTHCGFGSCEKSGCHTGGERFWGPKENAQGLFLFLVLEWNKTKLEKDKHSSSLWTEETGVWSPGIPFGISICCDIFIIIKSQKIDFLSWRPWNLSLFYCSNAWRPRQTTELCAPWGMVTSV